jgi:ATP-dependent Clp protease protease subunit
MSNIIYLTDDDDGNNNINEIIKSILEINEENEEIIEPSPIKLYINSYGGDVYHFLGLIDVIITSKTPIHTYALGTAMSCALLVALSGHKRFAYKHSTFMYHQISLGDWDIAKNLEEDLIETKRLHKIIEKLILDKTNISKKQIKNTHNYKKDWYFNAEEALKMKVIDQII